MPMKRCNRCRRKVLISHATFKKGYCIECYKKERQDYNDRERNDKYGKFYRSTEYKKFRQKLYIENPYCNRCLQDGKYVPSRICHHIIPIKEDFSKRFDENNIEFLCQSCHNQEHKTKDKY